MKVTSSFDNAKREVEGSNPTGITLINENKSKSTAEPVLPLMPLSETAHLTTIVELHVLVNEEVFKVHLLQQ